VSVLQVLEGVYRESLWSEANETDPLRGDKDETFGRKGTRGEPQMPPPLPPILRLRVRRLSVASPLDALLAIPTEFYAAAGPFVVVNFLDRLERVFNMPQRIRLENVRLDRDYWQAQAERDDARDRYYKRSAERSNYELAEGQLEAPDGWDWPQAP
jgi:hypothetical protein